MQSQLLTLLASSIPWEFPLRRLKMLFSFCRVFPQALLRLQRETGKQWLA
jgi:hypothetical protein